MRPVARHLGLVVLVLGACALIGAAPKREPAAKPAKAAKATTAKATAANPVKKSQPTAAAKAAPVAATPKVAPATAGMRIYFDPETGTIGGIPSGVATEAIDLSNEVVGEPVITVLPDGSVQAELNGACQEFSTIHRAADGSIHMNCVQGPRGLAKSAKNTKVPPVGKSTPQPEDR